MLNIQVVGIGCAKCNQLKANLKEAIKRNGMKVKIEEITDVNKIIDLDISSIPALRINGKTVFQDIVPNVEDIEKALRG